MSGNGNVDFPNSVAEITPRGPSSGAHGRSAAWAWLLLAVGWLLFLLSWPFGIALFLSSVFLFGFIQSGSAVDEWWGFAAAATFFAAVCSGLFWAGNELIARSKRLRAPLAEQVLAGDHRPPIVYLRSFQADGKVVPLEFGRVNSTYEEHLAGACRDLGPLVAIGRPDESLPEVGAARLYVGDRPWQEEVKRLLSGAQAVVLAAGETPGLMWELKTVIAMTPPERLLIFLPFGHETKTIRSADYQQAYARFRNWANPLLPKGLPVDVGDALFVYFTSDWTPHALVPPRATLLVGWRIIPLAGVKTELRPLLEALRQDRVFLRPMEFNRLPMLIGAGISIASAAVLIPYEPSVWVMVPAFTLPILVATLVGLALERKL